VRWLSRFHKKSVGVPILSRLHFCTWRTLDKINNYTLMILTIAHHPMLVLRETYFVVGEVPIRVCSP
jgi:hypothetical protein